MAGTLDQQTLEAFRLSNFSLLQTNISAFLAEYIASRNVLSLADFALNPIIDLANYKRKITADANLLGLHVFAPDCEKLILPNLDSGSLGNGKINVSEFKKLKVLSTSGGQAWQAFEGDISKLTALEEINYVYLDSFKIVSPMFIPVLSANTGLKTVVMNGNGFASVVTTVNCGNLQNNLLLKYFKLTYLNVTTVPLKAMIDNILSSLKAQKLAGGAIETIIMTACPAPTGGAANADAVWLAANGVSVTLGTI